MSFWARLYRNFVKSRTPANHQERLAVAYLAFELTEEGQKEARLRGVDADRRQIINVMVSARNMDVFHVDDDGFLTASTYADAMMVSRRIRRSPLLLADVSFNAPPTDGFELIEWIRTISYHQHEMHERHMREREEQERINVVGPLERAILRARAQGLMGVDSHGANYARVQIDSGPSGSLGLVIGEPSRIAEDSSPEPAEVIKAKRIIRRQGT